MTTVSQRVMSPFASTQHAGTCEEAVSAPRSTARRRPSDLPLRELTGWEEELVDRRRSAGNTARLCNDILARCLCPPGVEPDATDRARVGALLVAERDRALVQLRCASLGPDVKFESACTSCGAGNQVSFSLAALDLDFDLPAGPIRCEFGDGGSAELRAPSAADQEELFELALQHAAERKSWLLSRVLTRYRAKSDGLDADFVRDLPLRERNTLQAALDSALPDFDFRMSTRCCSCDADLKLPFDVSVFFLAS
jgi:hypothetical protein